MRICDARTKRAGRIDFSSIHFIRIYLAVHLFMQTECNGVRSDQLAHIRPEYIPKCKTHAHTWPRISAICDYALCPQRETRNTRGCFIDIIWPRRSARKKDKNVPPIVIAVANVVARVWIGPRITSGALSNFRTHTDSELITKVTGCETLERVTNRAW